MIMTHWEGGRRGKINKAEGEGGEADAINARRGHGA
jgi:hypothetical protein